MCWSTRTLYSCGHLCSYKSGGCDRYLTGKCKLDNRVVKLSERCRDCRVGDDSTLGRGGVEGRKGKKEREEKGKKGKKGWLKRALS